MHAHRSTSAIPRTSAAASPGGGQGRGAADLFLVRLRLLTQLDDAALDALARLYGQKRQLRAKVELSRQGEPSRGLHVLLDGWACRYRLLPDGQRQITQLLLPGDVCDLDMLHLRKSYFGITTLTSSTFVALDGEALRRLALEHPRIGAALSWLGAVENATLAERNACLGRRAARAHVAHLICELMLRLRITGQATSHGFTLPITQEEIADVLGLTSVHVNRMLQSLKADQLIKQNGSALIVLDQRALERAAGFHPGYLHLDGIDGTCDVVAKELRTAGETWKWDRFGC